MKNNNENNKIPLRHGDWILYRSKQTFTDENNAKQKDFTFATGEASNHHHTFHVSAPEKFRYTKRSDGSYIVEFREDAIATHPEHSVKVDLEVKKGTHKVIQKREKDWFALTTRKVID